MIMIQKNFASSEIRIHDLEVKWFDETISLLTSTNLEILRLNQDRDQFLNQMILALIIELSKLRIILNTSAYI